MRKASSKPASLANAGSAPEPNQSIDDSSAPLAQDLRIIIRNKIMEGSTDEGIYKFLTDRYGDFILLNPPFKANTIILWILPFVFFIIGIIVLYRHNKK